MRLVASLGHYAATRDEGGLQIHQYGAARIAADLPTGGSVALRIESDYPWDGRVRIVDRGERPGAVDAQPAHPGLERDDAAYRSNGEPSGPRRSTNGYARLERVWRRGDVVEMDLAMTPRLTEGHPWIESTRGCVAIERGPLVYCLEQTDQQAPVYDLEIDPSAPLTASWQPDLLDGVTTVRGRGFKIDRSAWEGLLYRPFRAAASSAKQPVELTAVPVYAWANRGPAR